MALAALLVILALALAASYSASQKGFQSINCGGGAFFDPNNTLTWEEDPFNNDNNGLHGRNSKVESSFHNVASVLTTLRYFPNDGKNKKFCYSLQVSNGMTYLVRASFVYGNYDRLNEPPSFILIINYNEWIKVNTSSSATPIRHELTFVSEEDNLNICLAADPRTNHTPFISTLELRPLESTMYVNNTNTGPQGGLLQGRGLKLSYRINYGASSEAIIRYPNDSYDRIWEADTSRPTLRINASEVGVYDAYDPEKPPAAVMATAITSSDPQRNLSFTYDGYGGDDGFLIELHFQELDETARGQSFAREFGMTFSNSTVLLKAIGTPEVQIAPALDGANKVSLDQYLELPLPFNITLFSLEGSPRGPLLNAIELFRWTPPLSTIGTNQSDVVAITLIQKYFKIMGFGQGDPCTPKGYEWDWIACSEDPLPRITEINLGNLNLTGNIPQFINDLQNLKKIDLSHNMLTGPIPNLSSLHELEDLDVSYNNLCGSSPSFTKLINYTSLVHGEGKKKVNGGMKSVRYVGNKGLCDQSECYCNLSLYSNTSNKRTRKYVFAISFMGAMYIVLLLVLFISYKAWKMKAKQDQTRSSVEAKNKGALACFTDVNKPPGGTKRERE